MLTKDIEPGMIVSATPQPNPYKDDHPARLVLLRVVEKVDRSFATSNDPADKEARKAVGIYDDIHQRSSFAKGPRGAGSTWVCEVLPSGRTVNPLSSSSIGRVIVSSTQMLKPWEEGDTSTWVAARNKKIREEAKRLERESRERQVAFKYLLKVFRDAGVSSRSPAYKDLKKQMEPAKRAITLFTEDGKYGNNLRYDFPLGDDTPHVAFTQTATALYLNDILKELAKALAKKKGGKS